jgi:uncharacterized protein
MKFIVDVMLGKLAKWLRILGYDTLYDSSFTDEQLFFTAHLEKRILLTHDRALAERMNPSYCYYITSFRVQVQIRDVVQRFDLDWQSHLFTRCTLCNTPVQPVAKAMVQDRVPPFVWNIIDQFVLCPLCDKVYWPGSHIEHVRSILMHVLH